MNDDDIYGINDMLIWIINYVHLDMVLLRLFITETDRYMCCYSYAGYYESDYDEEEDYDEDEDEDEEYEYEYTGEEDEDDYDEEAEGCSEYQSIEDIKCYFIRSIILNHHFIHTSSILKSLDKVGQPLVDDLLAGFKEMQKHLSFKEPELLESAWENLWTAWENFVNKFYKEYGYAVILPN